MVVLGERDDDFNRRVIKAVCERPILYDPGFAGYSNAILKAKAWDDVAKELEVNVIFVKVRWRSLRDRFCRDRKRLLKGPRGARHSFSLYPLMEFLSTHVDDSKSRRRIRPSETAAEASCSDDAMEGLRTASELPRSYFEAIEIKDEMCLLMKDVVETSAERSESTATSDVSDGRKDEDAGPWSLQPATALHETGLSMAEVATSTFGRGTQSSVDAFQSLPDVERRDHDVERRSVEPAAMIPINTSNGAQMYGAGDCEKWRNPFDSYVSGVASVSLAGSSGAEEVDEDGLFARSIGLKLRKIVDGPRKDRLKMKLLQCFIDLFEEERSEQR